MSRLIDRFSMVTIGSQRVADALTLLRPQYRAGRSILGDRRQPPPTASKPFPFLTRDRAVARSLQSGLHTVACAQSRSGYLPAPWWPDLNGRWQSSCCSRRSPSRAGRWPMHWSMITWRITMEPRRITISRRRRRVRTQPSLPNPAPTRVRMTTTMSTSTAPCSGPAQASTSLPLRRCPLRRPTRSSSLGRGARSSGRAPRPARALRTLVHPVHELLRTPDF